MTKPKKAQRARPTNGEKAAVKLALGDAPPAPPSAPYTEQMDLLEDLIGFRETVTLSDARANRAAAVKGRPLGSKNKRTIEWAEYLLSRYSSPLEVLAQIATMSIEELVAGLRCTKLEALQEKRLAAIALLPYVHAKQPVAIDFTKRQIVTLVIVEPEVPAEVAQTPVLELDAKLVN